MGTQYATIADLDSYGIPSAALAGLTATQKNAALESASRRVDSYLAAQFTLPLVAWESDVKRACCVLAKRDLLTLRGYNPDGIDATIATEVQEVLTWLEGISFGRITPQVTDSSAGASVGVPEAPIVISSSQRGWSVRGTGNDRGPFQGD